MNTVTYIAKTLLHDLEFLIAKSNRRILLATAACKSRPIDDWISTYLKCSTTETTVTLHGVKAWLLKGEIHIKPERSCPLQSTLITINLYAVLVNVVFMLVSLAVSLLALKILGRVKIDLLPFSHFRSRLYSGRQHS